MLNPLTNKPLAGDAAEQVEKLRTARRNARLEARSGNPAKRYPARRAVALANALIRKIYVREVSR
jgi:hypothetical protein